MTRAQLKQYHALLLESESIGNDIEKLEKRLGEVPTVAGKVQASDRDFPFIEHHVTVEIESPRQADSIKRRIKLKQEQKERAEEQAHEIEQFIANLDDSIDRQILELIYIDGYTQENAAEKLDISTTTISRRLSNIIKRYDKEDEDRL